MFTIGEFSRIAQVSKRLLHYYDEIGLLKPMHVDTVNGYRYYSADQLPILNRILALKDLGLSLEQIQRFMKDDVSPDEINGMLMMKKAELEEELLEGLKRIRNIESRLSQIKGHDSKAQDVVVKQVPAQYLLGTRRVHPDFEAGKHFFGSLVSLLPMPNDTIYGYWVGVVHADPLGGAGYDLECGRLIHESNHRAIVLDDETELAVRSLPAVQTMATYVQHGISEEAHVGFSAIGTWAEQNGYRLAGASHEVILEMPENHDPDKMVVEFQFPVEKQASTFNSLTSIDSV